MNWQADQQPTWEPSARELVANPPDASLRIAVLAAHPDDETIGASALLARFPESRVIYLTDGAPRDERFWTCGPYSSRQEYAARRHAEATDALAHAGVSDKQVFWLGAVDQEAVFEIPELIYGFANLLKKIGPEVVITHPYEGGHPDHDSASLIAQLALSLLDRKPQLVEMTSYRAEQDKCVTGKFLESQGWSPGVDTRSYANFLGRGDSRSSASTLAPKTVTIDLPDDDRQRKKRMFDAYTSQHLVLKDFSTERELFRPAPKYDFSQPPHEGKLWYECMGWPMTGKRWRELAAAAIAEFREHSCR
jgi:LmbE family N-acetylglucosaminyl deacetylase